MESDPRLDRGLEEALAALERLRGSLGDAAVEAARASLLAGPTPSGGRGAGPSARGERGERKLVSALFADFAGYTSLVASGDPETVRDLVAAAFSVLVPVLERYGATIEKFSGDGVMALFGAPLAHEEDARRACLAALSLHEVLGDFNEARGSDLALHVGVGTGLVVTGSLGPAGHRSYAAVGDAVNRAARIAALAAGGEVLVDAATMALAGPGLVFAALPPAALKGFAAPVPLHRLEASVPDSGEGSAEGPFLGREAELALLAQAWEESSAGNAALLVHGEGGIGKTRLAHRFLRGLAGPPGPRLVELRLYSYDADSPLRLWSSLIEILSGVGPAEASAARRAKVRAWLGGLALEERWRECLLRLFPLSRREEGEEAEEAGATPPGRPEPALAALLAALAGSSRLLFLVDDAQYCDAASATLLGALAGGAYPAPAFWLLLSRDPELPRLGIPGLRRLALGPLPPPAAAALLDRLMEGCADRPAADPRPAGGNPLFLEELARQARSASTCGEGEGGVGLFGLIAARIDALPESAREAARVAAVLGDRFFADLPAAMLDEPPLDLLLRSAILEADPDGESLSFRHGLLREAVYASILESRRRELHARAARALKELHADFVEARPGVMALHWHLAGEPRKALPYYRSLATDLYFMGSRDEAERHAATGLELARRTGSTIHAAAFLERIGQCRSRGGDPASALPFLDEALAIQRGLANRTRELSLARHRAFALGRAGRHAEALSGLEEALALAEAAKSRKDRILVLLDQAWALRASGDPGAGADKARLMLAEAAELGMGQLVEKGLAALAACGRGGGVS